MPPNTSPGPGARSLYGRERRHEQAGSLGALAARGLDLGLLARETYFHLLALEEQVGESALNPWQWLYRFVTPVGYALLVGDDAFIASRGARDLGDPRYTKLEPEKALRGGMGAVFRCHDALRAQVVAVKVLHRTGDAVALRRFEREFKTMARLRSPTCLSVLDCGVTPEGHPYFVMPWVEGASLEARIDEALPAFLPQAQVLGWLSEVASALHDCHLQGVVHRDVKPANILLSAAGRPYLSDFGIAGVLGASERLTLKGALVGTPAYMAPEQLTGAGDEADPRSDVYALGATLYHALTGAQVFEAEGLALFIAQVLSAAPSPPSQLNPEVAPALDALVLRCLEKNPERRFQSAGDLAQALDDLLGEAPGRGDGKDAARARTAAPATSARPRAAAPVALLVGLSMGGGLGFAATRAILDDSRGEAVPAAAPSAVNLRSALEAADARVADLEARALASAPAAEPVAAQPTRALVPAPQPPAAPALPPGLSRVPDGVVAGERPGEWRHEKTGIVLVWVPHAGSGTSGFLAGKNEVTWRQYRGYCKAAGVLSPPHVIAHAHLRAFEAQDDHPVFHVSWEDAQGFCDWAGLRLPLESEWDRAACSPIGGPQPGDDRPARGAKPVGNIADLTARRMSRTIEFLRDYDDGHFFPAPVGSYPAGASWCGALDMVGNVWEWTASGSAHERVVRGGGYTSSSLAATQRSLVASDRRLPIVGFRVALSAP